MRDRTALRRAAFVIGLAVLILAAGATAGPGQVRDVKAATIVELTVTKWFSPHFPASIGVVGGDFSGTFSGLLLQRDVIAGGQIVLFKASYSVAAGANSFSVLGEGRQNNEIHTSVFNGEVTAGSLTGAQVHEEYDVVSCSQAPNGLCFVGTIRIM